MSLSIMNKVHYKGAMWGLSQLNLQTCNRVLNIGCGGGMNIKNLLAMVPDAVVCGIDYSAASVEKSRKLNRRDIERG